jgi:hypothetical protein
MRIPGAKKGDALFRIALILCSRLGAYFFLIAKNFLTLSKNPW